MKQKLAVLAKLSFLGCPDHAFLIENVSQNRNDYLGIILFCDDNPNKEFCNYLMYQRHQKQLWCDDVLPMHLSPILCLYFQIQALYGKIRTFHSLCEMLL